LLIALSLLSAFVMPIWTQPVNAADSNTASSWTTLTSMPTSRGDFGITVVEGKIYVIGGTNENNEPLSTVEVYNPLTNEWASKMSMITPRSGFATAVFNNKIYVFGGSTGSGYTGNTEVFDPEANSWEPAASLPTPRAALTAAVVDNCIYVIGGIKYSSVSPYYVETGINECYDPTVNTWTTKTSLPTGVYGCASAVANNKIYVIGGAKQSTATSSLTLVGNNQVYNVETNQWSIAESLPETTMYGAAATTEGIVSPQAIYYVGGYTGGAYTNQAYIFTFSYNSWNIIEDMPVARGRLGLVVVADVLYAIGGYDGTNWVNTNEKYTPVGYGTVAPKIQITSPRNETYQQVSITWTINKEADWIGYAVDGGKNVTLHAPIRIASLPQGNHRITLYANDSLGNMGVSNTVYFSIDSVAPSLTIINPTNQSYDSTDIQLLFSVDEPNAILSYSLDGQTNQEIIGNMTLVALSNGGHYVTVYAADSMGNVAEEIVYFNIAPFPWLLVVAVLTIVIIVLAAGYIVFKLKKKSDEK
jgi:N-acetylneuraminic acid mutarotase